MNGKKNITFARKNLALQLLVTFMELPINSKKSLQVKKFGKLDEPKSLCMFE